MLCNLVYSHLPSENCALTWRSHWILKLLAESNIFYTCHSDCNFPYQSIFKFNPHFILIVYIWGFRALYNALFQWKIEVGLDDISGTK